MSPNSWRRALLPSTATLKDAIALLNESGLRIALMTDTDGTLMGTITDGDIRRGLMRGVGLGQPAREIVRTAPLVVPPEIGRDLVVQLMMANSIQHIPIVDSGRRVVGLHFYQEAAADQQRPNLLVIMAGGKGTRLRPLTEDCPKSMLPVAGKPMLEHIVYRAKLDGFTQITIAIHHLGNVIEDHFGDGSGYGVRIQYLREETPLGTAGALGLLHPRPTHPVVVTNGDVLSDVRFDEIVDFHERQGACATMAVRAHELQNPFGVVVTNGLEIVGFEEKPIVRTQVNAGIYVLSPEALAAVPSPEPCDMPMLFMRLRDRGQRAVVYPVHEHWLDVGQAGDYAHAQSVLAART